MENENKSLVKVTNEMRLPKFVEDAYDSIDKMNQFAEILLQSRLIPYHFYEKGTDGKPDFTKGKTPAVVAVLLQGHQLSLPPLTALQHVVPVNGLLSIKGDMAKSLIFNSGKLKADSWKEEEFGSLEAQDFMVKITATRSDNGMTISRSFSIAQAKRAGLWITDQQVSGQDGWKYKNSAWYKFPLRMIYYRALGFLARDGFSDVLTGIYTTEEAMDMPKETADIIETPDGGKIIIPDKEHAKKRSEKLTERVADKIQPDKFAPVQTETPHIQEAVIIPEHEVQTINDPPVQGESPFIPSRDSVEYMNGVKVIRDSKTNEITNMDEINKGKEEPQGSGDEGKWTLKQMEEMDTKLLLAKVNSDTDMMEASEMIGGKNTNKKLREIIFAWQNGNLAEHVAPYVDNGQAPEPISVSEDPGIKPNKEFDKQKADREADEFLNGPSKKPEDKQSKVSIVNKYGLEIPEVVEGSSRDFSEVKKLYNLFLGITPKLDNPRYLEVAGQMGILTKYPDREIFLRNASISEINLLLNNN